MGLFVTGDVHGAIYDRFSETNFPLSFLSSGKNYVIVCGDFGGIWGGGERDEHWLKWLSKQPFILLFVDGNHENFNLLNTYPVQIWNGGKIHRIRHNVYHLMRGQVFNIHGKKILTFGGAASMDKASRLEDISWWKEEMPSEVEYDEAIHNLELNDYTVDYIFTHTCSTRVLNTIPEYRLFSGVREADSLMHSVHKPIKIVIQFVSFLNIVHTLHNSVRCRMCEDIVNLPVVYRQVLQSFHHFLVVWKLLFPP